jgi:hypothetical protein
VIREASDLLNERPLPGHVVPEGQRPTSGMGQTQKSECATGKSALPSTTGIVSQTSQVRSAKTGLERRESCWVLLSSHEKLVQEGVGVVSGPRFLVLREEVPLLKQEAHSFRRRFKGDNAFERSIFFSEPFFCRDDQSLSGNSPLAMSSDIEDTIRRSPGCNTLACSGRCSADSVRKK